LIQTVPLPSPELRARVAEIARWTAAARWTALFGGRTNAAWQVTDGTQSLVLKLYRASTNNPLFPNDAKAEALMLRHLSTLEIAPELVASFDSADGCCTLYHAIPGTAWTTGIQDVAQMMRRLHAQPIPSGLRALPNGSAEVLAHADTILARCEETADLVGLRPQMTVPATEKTVLLHCDMVPGNLISSDDGLRLIDWQCPGVGDPCEDIAIFLSPAMQELYRGQALTPDETQRFLASYPDMGDRYRALAPAYHYRMAAYCRWQVEHGVPDYAAGLAAEISALRSHT
jgi:aminoglycoside phosphotransferase (APT) family kinase protein